MTSHEPHLHPQPTHSSGRLSDALIGSLLSALGRAGAEATMEELQRAVCDRVRSMRDEGALPESVLAAIKKLAAATVRDAGTARGGRPGDAAAVVAQIGQWCIAEYFRKS